MKLMKIYKTILYVHIGMHWISWEQINFEIVILIKKSFKSLSPLPPSTVYCNYVPKFL